MDEMTAFERQLAAEMEGMVGPMPRFDVAAIAGTATTQSPKRRFQSMFSATKFVVAGAIVALFGGFLLAGGLTQPSEEVAPAATSAGPGTFSPTGSLAQPRAEHSATLLPDGRVLVVGGFDVREEDNTSTAEIWDPDTDTFGPTGSLAHPRAGHTATLLPDGRVLVVGGWGDEDTEDFVFAEVWDPSTGAFSPAGSIAMGWADSATLLPDGRVLVVGSLEVKVWDPATSTFSPADSLLVGDQRATALADGRVLIISDEDPYGNAYPASAEVWDPVTDTFSPAGSSALGRIRSYTLLADGRVLFLGDASTSDEDMMSAEVWDPATSTFSPSGSFPGAYRGMNTVTALADGRALIAGGCRFRNICLEHFDSAEVWDPATETFGPTGSPAVTRMRHTATALPDGRVLVVGGWEYANEGTVRASAEVWEPSDGQPPTSAQDHRLMCDGYSAR
jgi:WD40 repeat protein